MSENIIIAFIGAGGIVLGAIITLMGGMWQSYLQSKREYKMHLRVKREDVYKKACDSLMIQDKCIRKNLNSTKWYKVFNELQADIMLYASKSIRKEYYKIGIDIQKLHTYASQKNKNLIQIRIADKIMSLNDKMRKELKIND